MEKIKIVTMDKFLKLDYLSKCKVLKEVIYGNVKIIEQLR